MNWHVYEDRRAMGQASAAAGAQALRDAIARDGRVAAIFASAVSQSEFLETLARTEGIDWSKVTAFHMDEYTDLSSEHPASFRKFLHDHLWKHVTPAIFHELRGDAADKQAEIDRYSTLLRAEQPSIVFAGIGENGHLAFNDPPVDFETADLVRVVELDEVCRRQQVHDGAFPDIMDVPRTALTLTIPALLKAEQMILNVPGKNKAEAVRRTIEGPITPDCPASVLQRHANAAIYLDRESASLLTTQS